jgi:hypothetical protein
MILWSFDVGDDGVVVFWWWIDKRGDGDEIYDNKASIEISPSITFLTLN